MVAEVNNTPWGERHCYVLRPATGEGGRMAAAFDKAGFTSVDVHMSDLLSGRVSLKDFAGLVACGGFSYGDVLGAGEGWAKSIRYNPRAREVFGAFFARMHHTKRPGAHIRQIHRAAVRHIDADHEAGSVGDNPVRADSHLALR